MKKTLYFNLLALIAVVVLAAPNANAGHGYGSEVAVETLRIKRQLTVFCNLVEEYVHPRHQSYNEKYAMRKLADFDHSLDRLLNRVDTFGPRSLFLKSDADRIQSDYFTAKRYLKYLDLPLHMHRRFARIEVNVNLLDGCIERGHRGPDYDTPRVPDRFPDRGPDRFEPDYPRNEYVNLKPYAEELEDEADDMMKHVRAEGAQASGRFENRRGGEGDRGRGRSRVEEGIHHFQLLEEYTDEFEKKARGHYAWSRELAVLHARIESQYRIAGQFVDVFGPVTAKDHQTFGRYMYTFLKKNPYGRLGDVGGRDRDRYDDRDWGSERDRDRGGYGGRGRLSSEGDNSTSGSAWSVNIDF